MFNNKVEVIKNINSKLKLFKINDNISNTIFFFSISTCEPIVPNIWWTRNDKCKNYIAYITHQPKRFLVFISCKYNYQKIHKAFYFSDGNIPNININ